MTPWAERRSPDSTNAATAAFCSSVKVTPARPSAVRPFSGSLRALPSITLADSAVPNPRADRSSAAFVARSKILLPLPVSFRMFVNDRSRFSLVWISSSSIPVRFDNRSARSATWSSVTFAAPPVDLIAAVVSLPILTDSRPAVTESPRKSKTFFPTKIPPAAAAIPPKVALNLEAIPPVTLSTSVLS
jgi:hypothetical protein